MRSPTPDLSSLAALARNPGLDLRPVILRVQADLFVNAPARDDASVEAFSALVTGLLPTVDDETALIVATKLAPCPDTPADVLRLLIGRGGAIRRAILAPREATAAAPSPAAPEAASSRPSTPLPAASPDAPGQSPAAALVEARSDGGLARRLLGRGDLAPGDEAVLYLHADAERRARIRSGLLALAGLRHALPPRAEAPARERLIESAARADAEGFAASLGGVLGLGQPLAPLNLQGEADQELLALALHAAGLSEEECIRIFLTLDPALARSVRGVFHLAGLVRTTSRAVAAHVVEAVLGADFTRVSTRHQPAMDPSGASRGTGAMQAARNPAALAQAARERRAAGPRERRVG